MKIKNISVIKNIISYDIELHKEDYSETVCLSYDLENVYSDEEIFSTEYLEDIIEDLLSKVIYLNREYALFILWNAYKYSKYDNIKIEEYFQDEIK